MFHAIITHIYDNHINLRFIYIFGGSGLLCGMSFALEMSHYDQFDLFCLKIIADLNKSPSPNYFSWSTNAVLSVDCTLKGSNVIHFKFYSHFIQFLHHKYNIIHKFYQRANYIWLSPFCFDWIRLALFNDDHWIKDHPFKTTAFFREGGVTNWTNLPTNSSKKTV